MLFLVPNPEFISFILNVVMGVTLTMSSPPMRSPLTYSCGYVGQLEYVLSPCLTCEDNQKYMFCLKTPTNKLFI